MKQNLCVDRAEEKSGKLERIKTTQAKCFCLASEADGDVSFGRERSEEGGNRKVVKATTLLLPEASAKL